MNEPKPIPTPARKPQTRESVTSDVSVRKSSYYEATPYDVRITVRGSSAKAVTEALGAAYLSSVRQLGAVDEPVEQTYNVADL